MRRRHSLALVELEIVAWTATTEISDSPQQVEIVDDRINDEEETIIF